MIVNKVCAYRTTTVNVLPALVFVRLYSANAHCPAFTRAQWISWGARTHDGRDINTPVPYPKAGWRLCFKLFNFHLGIEVLNEPRRTT